jgi:hypothetical protein
MPEFATASRSPRVILAHAVKLMRRDLNVLERRRDAIKRTCPKGPARKAAKAAIREDLARLSRSMRALEKARSIIERTSRS